MIIPGIELLYEYYNIKKRVKEKGKLNHKKIKIISFRKYLVYNQDN